MLSGKHFDNTPFGLLVWNHQAKMIYCSPKAASLLGWKSDEPFQMPIDLLKFVPKDERITVSRLIDDIVTGKIDHNGA